MAEYDTIDQLVASADSITGKVGEYLRENLEQLRVSRLLTEIKLDVALKVTPESLALNAPDAERLRDLYSELEFRSWLRELDDAELQDASAPTPEPEAAADYQTLLTDAELDHWLTKLAAADCFAVDTETTSLDAQQAKLVGLSFCIDAGEASLFTVGTQLSRCAATIAV